MTNETSIPNYPDEREHWVEPSITVIKAGDIALIQPKLASGGGGGSTPPPVYYAYIFFSPIVLEDDTELPIDHATLYVAKSEQLGPLYSFTVYTIDPTLVTGTRGFLSTPVEESNFSEITVSLSEVEDPPLPLLKPNHTSADWENEKDMYYRYIQIPIKQSNYFDIIDYVEGKKGANTPNYSLLWYNCYDFSHSALQNGRVSISYNSLYNVWFLHGLVLAIAALSDTVSTAIAASLSAALSVGGIFVGHIPNVPNMVYDYFQHATVEGSTVAASRVPI